MPIIRKLYCRRLTYSQAVFKAINTKPNVLVSMPVCFFDVQYIGERFRNTITPVCNLWGKWLQGHYQKCLLRPYFQDKDWAPLQIQI